MIEEIFRKFLSYIVRLLTVSNEVTNKLSLYSIELNRFNQNEFVLAGLDPYIRVFDRRYIDSNTTKPLKSFCPDLLVNKANKSRMKLID
jgi:hypothetical protein